MIKFSLRCIQGHAFESWFQSGPAFDGLRERGLVTCPSCGSSEVSKALMAPSVSPARKAPTPEMREKLAALRAEIEANTDYVGERFAEEARAMYLGDIPDRPIHGEARLEDAKALLEDGIPVLPLPFLPSRKAN
ncbi:DUF1178 family protein [Natronohydrobacter thiooxidans]|jgi:hypothetical protein|uniref:DUF1178 family protein n=1 Tax=Natronohydrobacter thiooxidans TaxID=87172 RepID=UPI0008FF05AF|nr:DUF1178 family protein [Natronohydrobacter thiooxidans]